MTKIYAILIFIIYSGFLFGQKSFHNVNAPVINVKKLINSNEDLNEITQNAILIEFWATWCKPCIETIPHINNLAEEFKDDSITILSLNSFDTEEQIYKFLSHTSMHTMVVLDDEKKTYENFGVREIPTMYLIDKQGYLRWEGRPGQVTPEFLTEFLEYDKIVLPEIENPFLFSFDLSYSTPSDKCVISYIEGENSGFSFSSRTIQNILEHLLKSSGFEPYEFQIIGNIPLEPRLNLEFRANKSIERKKIHVDVIERLAMLLNFEVSDEIESKTFWNLSISDSVLLQKALSIKKNEDFWMDENDTEYWVRNIQISQMSDYLSLISSEIINTDIQNIPGKFNFNLPKGKLSDIANFLEIKYGIKLLPVKKDVNVKIIQFY